MTGQVDIQAKTAQPRDEALAFARRLDAALRSSLVPGSFIVGGDVPYSMLASAPFKLIPAGGGAPVRNDMVVVREIAPGALDFFRIRLIRGREFQESDDRSAPPVALVNETFVRRFARGQEVIGATLDGGPDRPSPTIVGVVADVRDSALSRPATEALYLPFLQWSSTTLFIATRGIGLAGALQGAAYGHVSRRAAEDGDRQDPEVRAPRRAGWDRASVIVASVRRRAKCSGPKRMNRRA